MAITVRLCVVHDHVMIDQLTSPRQVQAVQHRLNAPAVEVRAQVVARDTAAERQRMMRHPGIPTHRGVQRTDVKCTGVFVLKLHVLHLRIVGCAQFGDAVVKITGRRAAPAFQHGQPAVRPGANVTANIGRDSGTAGAEVVHAHGRFKNHIVRHADEWPIGSSRRVQCSKGILGFRRGGVVAGGNWAHFHAWHLSTYDEGRNRPDLDGTSAMSHHLKYGEIHPRSILAELTDADDGFRREICWREFYAEVLHQRPDSVRASLDARYDSSMRWVDDEEAFDAWAHGRTGFPFVDAGMRQLRAEGWMHNRVRMVVASFLVKDLHQPWQRGAAEFMHWLRDGDVASNTHGWQWTAGCGTDASPFYRVFNPISQGLKFDPQGDYVRRYIPELGHLTGKTAHEPWDVLGGYDHGYPEPIVDHKAEREVALADFAAIKKG